MSETTAKDTTSQRLATQWLARGHTSPARRPLRTWALSLLLCITILLLVQMPQKNSLTSLAYALSLILPVWTTPLDNVISRELPPPQQSVNSNDSAAYWFSEFQGTLDTLQNTYWNGSYWPDTIQWIGAFLNTLLASSALSMIKTLESPTNISTSPYSDAQTFANVSTLLSQIQTYYTTEDVTQIFSAAYDDAQWVVLEWLEALHLLSAYDTYAHTTHGSTLAPAFAHRAHLFYNIVQNQFNRSLCSGGLTWNPHLAPYKNAITNQLFLATSSALYLHFPGDNNTSPYPSNQTNTTLPPLPNLDPHDPLLLTNALEEYSWFTTTNFPNSQHLITDGFHISPNQTTCDQRNEMVYSYNQAVLLSGLRNLYLATGNSTYLTDGYDLITATVNATGWNAQSETGDAAWAGLGRGGVLQDSCDAARNCSQDAAAFKGIYFTHLNGFCEELPTENFVVEGEGGDVGRRHGEVCDEIAPWVFRNARAALGSRDAGGVVAGWWGAGLGDRSQGKVRVRRVPRGSWDRVGERERCRGCGSGERKRRRDDDDGLQRTVETQGSGVGVVRAASEFARRREGRR